MSETSIELVEEIKNEYLPGVESKKKNIFILNRRLNN